MPLSGPIVASRLLAVSPGLQQLVLMSRQPKEGGFIGYPWTGRAMPSIQDVTITADGVFSKDMKVVQLIKFGQVIEPKEEDEIYMQVGSVQGKWGRWTVKEIDVQFKRAVFRCNLVFSVNVTPISISPLPLPPAKQAPTTYSVQLSAGGGLGGPFTFAIESGQLPTGLSMNTSGLIGGSAANAGEVQTFVIATTDAFGQTSFQQASISVQANPFVVSPLSFPVGFRGVPYSQQLTASGGGGSPYTFAVTNGRLPFGLTLSAGGLVSGTPTVSLDSQTFNITVTDARGGTLNQVYDILVF